jgi:hypothetical protein
MASLPLAELLSISETTATVTGTILNASGPGVLTIESEQISYTGNSDNQFFGLVRGYNSTVAAAHAANKFVTYVPDVVPGTVITISTTAPLTGGGDISANRTFAMPVATDAVDGYMSAAAHTALTAAVPNTRTVNGHALSSNVTVTTTDIGAATAASPAITGQATIVNTTADTDGLTITNTTASRGLLVNGKVIARRDNGSSLVVRGLQSPTEGVAVVSSYSGIFTDPSYSDTGTLDTRFIMGGNNEMDVDVQSPHQLRLTAGANDTSDGGVRVSAVTDIKLMARGANEVNAPKYLVIDRVDTTIHADPLTNNSSDVVVKVNTGSLLLNYGVTTGAVGLPVLTNTQRDAISAPSQGMVIANSDTSLLNWYNGSAWRAVNDSAVS